MYAAGRIPGAFFRREGRPSTDAILTCRLIDRPLRPSFVDGLRNEIQVVITVQSLNPDDPYDVLAINAASASTQIAGLPFSGPVGGVRVALIEGQWVAFPTWSQLEKATFNMVVAGRIVGDDVAIMMVEAEGTENTLDLIADGGQAPDEDVGRRGPRGREAVHQGAVRGPAEAGRRRRQADRRVPGLPGLPAGRLRGRRGDRDRRPGPARCRSRQAGPRRRDRRGQGRRAWRRSALGEGEAFEGREKEIGAAFKAADQEARAPARPARQDPHGRPWPHRHPVALGRGRRDPAGARLGAVRARRDPDPGCHHAEHASHGAADRLAVPGDAQALHAPLQLPALLHR